MGKKPVPKAKGTSSRDISKSTKVVEEKRKPTLDLEGIAKKKGKK